MSEPLVERDEIVGLRFNVSDIATTLDRILSLLEDDSEEEEEDD